MKLFIHKNASESIICEMGPFCPGGDELIVQLCVSWIVTMEESAADRAAHAVNQLSIVSDNGLSPIRHQAII